MSASFIGKTVIPRAEAPPFVRLGLQTKEEDVVQPWYRLLKFFWRKANRWLDDTSEAIKSASSIGAIVIPRAVAPRFVRLGLQPKEEDVVQPWYRLLKFFLAKGQSLAG